MTFQSLPQIISQTDSWLVVAKPSGWLTIPGRNQVGVPVLVSWLESQQERKVWVVHRIDLETSGLVLFALTAEAHREANQWFEKQQVRKSYDFLAQGNPSRPIFRIQHPIEGSPSVTQVEVKERFGSAFLGRATPLSGRRHQIRIHLAFAGHPLLGDTRYGGQPQMSLSDGRTVSVPRVALHAERLEIPGPKGEAVKFQAPWPEDFSAWVGDFRIKVEGKA